MDPTAEEQRAAFAEWVLSPAAKSRAEKILRRFGLPQHGSEDLCQQAYVNVERRLQSGPLAVDSTIAGYAYRIMENVAKGMVSGKGVPYDRFVSLDDEQAMRQVDAEHARRRTGFDIAVDVIERISSDGVSDSIRVELLAAAEADVWPLSAAFTVLTLSAEPDRDDGLGPRPASGSDAHRRQWTALWLAGRGELFPSGPDRIDTPALRKQRSRAIQRVEDRLKKTSTVSSAFATEPQ